MENNAKITGDNNTVIQEAKKSDININSNFKRTKNKGVIIGTVIAIIGVLVSIIVGWDSILKLFN